MKQLDDAPGVMDYCQEPESVFVKHLPAENIVYVVTNHTTAHPDALEECRALGGYLAMPKTDAQMAAVKAMIANRTLSMSIRTRTIWAMIHYSESEVSTFTYLEKK